MALLPVATGEKSHRLNPPDAAIANKKCTPLVNTVRQFISTHLKDLFMAIGWLTILKSVPWTDVISNAPKVADGAKKLWHSVGRNPTAPEAEETRLAAAPSEGQALATLAKRMAAMEATTVELQAQMLASSELLAALAEQNTQLIKGLEVNRRRVLGLGVISAALTIVAVVVMTSRVMSA